MKYLIVILMAVNLAGCMALRPIEGTASDLQKRIASNFKPRGNKNCSTVPFHYATQ